MFVQRWRKFISLSRREQLLLIEALFHLTLARVIILLLPFRWFSSRLGQAAAESNAELSAAQVMSAAQIGAAVARMSPHTLWDSACLTQAIAAQWMLNRRHIPSTLYLGIEKESKQKWLAHAWVRCGKIILVGANGYTQYTVVSSFANSPDFRSL